MPGVSTKEKHAQRWKPFLHHWQSYNESNSYTQTFCIPMNTVFANCIKEDEMYTLTRAEIAKAQRSDVTLNHLIKHNAVFDKRLEIKLIENTICVCKDDQLVIPKPLHVHAIMWYHHYLQHPGHIPLKEMMSAAMY
jgi:hypothetical protein